VRRAAAGRPARVMVAARVLLRVRHPARAPLSLPRRRLYTRPPPAAGGGMAAPSPSGEAAPGAAPPPALPAPGEGSAGGPALDISSGSATVKLDDLGPVVLNEDGTMSRIANWHAMTEREQEVTRRRIGKRNAERKAALEASAAAEAGG